MSRPMPRSPIYRFFPPIYMYLRKVQGCKLPCLPFAAAQEHFTLPRLASLPWCRPSFSPQAPACSAAAASAPTCV